MIQRTGKHRGETKSKRSGPKQSEDDYSCPQCGDKTRSVIQCLVECQIMPRRKRKLLRRRVTMHEAACGGMIYRLDWWPGESW
jgi:hypothetical protein